MTLDPTPALLVIDLQKGIVALPLLHPAAEIVSRSAALAHAFRARNYPVVLINVVALPPGRTTQAPRIRTSPEGWADLVPELNPQPTDLLLTKRSPGAFLTTNLHQLLTERGITQVILTGIATGSGVVATARSAFDLGYNLLTVTDAITDADEQAHTFTLTKLLPKLSELATTEEILSLLQP